MSGQAGSIGSIVLGVVLIVVGAFTLPEGGIFGIISGVAMIAGGAVGLAFTPTVDSQQNAKAKQLEIATAATGFPVPVIFGEQKVIGNYMNYTKGQFHSIAVPASSGGGGKGGGVNANPVTKFDYYLCYEYGLCMGPVDSMHEVYATPGEVKLSGTDPSGTAFSGDYVELNLSSDDEGGLIRVYQGNGTQTRISSGDPYFGNGMNYRNMCWALFGPGGGYKIGSVPQPKSYAFIIRRLPKCIRDDGTTVAGIRTSASADPSAPAYFQANPAAIIYEIMTNKLWGRGLSSDLFDETSFVNASNYFYGLGIGMSFTLSAADQITNVIDNIRQHLKTILVWDGDLLKLRVLLSIDQTHTPIQTVTDNEVMKLSVTRPDWFATINEVRAEFNNIDRNYRPDVVTVQDLANIQIVGGRINPQRIQLTGFTDFNIVRRQAFRILTELSYPLQTATFEMNRFRSQIEVGDVFRLIWKEWNDSTVTAYFMALKIEEGDSDSEAIKITALEDPCLCPVEAEETVTDLPDQQRFELLSDIDPGQIDLFVRFAVNTDPVITRMAMEVPSMRTGGVSTALIVLSQKPSSSVVSMEVLAGQAANNITEPAFTLLATQPTWAIGGTLTTAINATFYFDRSDTGFQFSLADFASDEGSLLSAASLVDGPRDDLETLINSHSCYMFIGEEILRIGKVDKLGLNLYRARNYTRANFGSEIAQHPIGQRIFFSTTFPATYGTGNLGTNPLNNFTKLKIYPVSNSGPATVGTSFFLFHEGADNNQRYLGQGRCPLRFSPLSITFFGAYWQAVMRPRYFNMGVESVESTITTMKSLTTQPTGVMSFEYAMYDAAGAIIGTRGPVTDFSWVPDSFSDKTAGVVKVIVTKNGQGFAKRVRVWTVIGGISSIDAAEFSV